MCINRFRRKILCEFVSRIQEVRRRWQLDSASAAIQLIFLLCILGKLVENWLPNIQNVQVENLQSIYNPKNEAANQPLSCNTSLD